METILDRCRRLNITLDPDIKKIAELQNEIRELTEEREWMAKEGEDTSAFDAALDHLRAELNRLTGR
jgi:hypothetical protein